MNISFIDQVESHLRTKSLRDLKALIMRLASQMPESEHKNFLEILEDKKTIINKSKSCNTSANISIERVQNFLDGIEDYSIEAYYYDNWHSDGWEIQDDDGFAEDVSVCYTACEHLLIQGNYPEAAAAFRLFFEALDRFNEYNAGHDYGALSVETFIDEGLLDINMDKAKALRGYSSLMAQGTYLADDLNYIYHMCTSSYSRNISFRDILNTGSEPVPNLENILTQWLAVLTAQSPEDAAPLIKEAAQLLDAPDVMEQFAKTKGLTEPTAHLALCEMLIEQNSTPEKIISAAIHGLKHTAVNSHRRGELALLLADTAKESNDLTSYSYAVLEHFYSDTNVANYLQIRALKSETANQSALTFLASKKGYHDTNTYHIINMLNGKYMQAFEAVKRDTKSLGWSYSLKGYLFPFFLGILTGFNRKALATKKLIEKEETDGLYTALEESLGNVTKEESAFLLDWCVKEVGKRVDGIVSNQHRGAYNRAAQLLVAVCEVRLLREEVNPFALLHKYLKKYPRHSAFHGEVRGALNEAKLNAY